MAVNIINFVFKVAIGVIVVNLLSSSVSSYNVIDSFAQDRFSNWMTTQNYYVVSKFRNSYEDPWDPQLREASYNSYCQLNENGAILADFYNYTDYVYSANMDLHDGVPYKSAWATINPNYLELFTVYDEDGVAVKVSETENKMVILIPCKYKEASGEISEYYEKVFSKDIQIIWLKEGQSVFSYSIDINPSNGNCVKDPILVVLTLENTSVDNWHYLDGYMGEPIKIKALSDNINARDEILTVFYSHYDEEKCTLTLSNIYDSVETDIYQIKVTAYWILGICAAFSVLLITVILQCLYLYFEERKQSIAVMYILGHSIFKRYSKLFEDVLASWIAILLIGMVIGNAVLIIYISSAGLLLELLGLLICIRCSEQKKIINVLKNE